MKIENCGVSFWSGSISLQERWRVFLMVYIHFRIPHKLFFLPGIRCWKWARPLKGDPKAAGIANGPRRSRHVLCFWRVGAPTPFTAADGAALVGALLTGEAVGAGVLLRRDEAPFGDENFSGDAGHRNEGHRALRVRVMGSLPLERT